MTSEASTTGFGHAEMQGETRRFISARAVLKFGCVSLFCGAVAVLAGCSNDPLQPEGAIWTGSANARTSTAAPDAIQRKGAYSAIGGKGAGSWGPYSGRRGQTSPPDLQNYAFKGDPNANGTFAPGPGQVQ